MLALSASTGARSSSAVLFGHLVAQRGRVKKSRIRKRSASPPGEGGYDPDVGPEAGDWLAMDEGERDLAVEAYHRAARIRLPNLRAHSLIHVVVENQLAEGFGPATRALTRLMSEGLGRHEAVHAVGSVLAGLIYSAMKDQQADTDEYERELDELTAEKWRSGGGAR